MKRMISLLLLLIVMLPSLGLAVEYCSCSDPQTHAERNEALERVLYGYNTMGAQVALIQDGRIIDTFQYGRANRQENTPVTSDTYFRIASVSKMVSAVGILQLLERGEVTLDGDIGEVFPFPIRNPYYPDAPITLRQIMSHTASLRDDYHYERATHGDIVSLEHVFDGNYTRNNFLRRAPGAGVTYSNFGGGLLGSIIEQQSGYTIDEYMQRYVFGPLGVSAGYHTPCLPHGAEIARVYNVKSTGMTLDLMDRSDEHWDPDPELNYVHSAGALIMNAEGLAKILIALAGDGTSYGATLLQPETVALMRENQNGIGSVACDAKRGLNLNIITNRLVQGRTLYGHQGKAYGMICAAYFDPTDQTGVVLLTNGCDDSTVDSVAKIARAVLSKAYTFFE